MRSTKRLLASLLLAALVFTFGCAALQQDLSAVLGSGAGSGGDLDEGTVARGLKEALRIGTGNTVISTSKVDGYLGNQLIRIAIPDQLQSAASTLRTIGLGSQVNELEAGMNRAAELAAGEARDIFWTAITGMSISDAFGILRGHDTAATEYFRARTGDALRERFRPIVEEKIGEIGLSRVYGQIADAYNGIAPPNADRLVDLDDYVTERALDGLFTVLGQEERKIREDPMARTTDLLRRVFGG
ncbi:MAG: DUF4197 domain-containing protein [Candidatus Krumholzibacteriota bacterium]|nr:DUF4197 domain-containing protein [Candidatus Krumholzibacteriota bacterium]